MDSGVVASHSNRSHHTQEKQEKLEEKKVGATASSSRATVDYREYREKKERERLEREKAAAASATAAQAHIADPSKHHSHHHKPVSSASLSNKHQLSSVQKGAGLHHNHHHRPDMKVGQPVPQRHSTGVQPREPNRDPNRQRLSREYAGASSTSAQSHAPVAHPSRDANLDISDAASHRTDITPAQDSASHSNTQEKPPSNNNYSVHRLNALDSKQAYDKRMHDPRHNKLVDHKKDGEQKAYGSKYLDPARTDRQRKLDTMEQRCEEVRKIIDKPVPLLPKAADVSYTSKQTHHAKYNQPSDKLQSGAVSLTADMKHAAMMSQNTLSQDKSPSAVASASAASQISQKTTSVKTVHSQHSVYGVSQILKDTIKNGSSQPCLTSLSNVDDPKSEKRPRVHDDSEKSSVDIQQSVPHQQTPPSSRHRSLFSPETPPTREPHAQRPKSKQKTPPSVARALKQERVSPFASPPASQQQDSLMMKRPFSEGIPSSHKRLRTVSTSENEQPVKVKMEDASNLEAMKMLGRVPDLIQSIRDTPSLSNCGRNSASSIANADLKPPEQLTIKPLDTDSASRFSIPMAQHKISSMNVQALVNGLDPNVVVKQEPLDHYAKKDQSHRIPQAVCVKSEHPHPHLQQPKLEYSPMKSAQSISALLQEPLAPMPSLLQGVQQHTQMPQQPLQQEQLQQQQLAHHPLIDHQPSMVTQSLSMSSASDNVASIVSTVDMSALSCMPITHQQSSVESVSTLTTVPTLTAVVSLEEKRSEHHKSEKKKKEKKHKHKDKEKSREKHKHKHKDKDKEKHREKDKEKSEETPAAAAPIKITIPKDKLNLGTETSPTVCAAGGAATLPDKNRSPQSTGLKIKIPKERLKAADSVSSSPAQPVMQGPLKIKIRTDLGISRTSTTSTSVSPSGTSGTVSGSHASSESVNETSRKRDRVELTESAATINCPPLTKKQAHVPSTGYSQGHRPGERQNGRHYSSGSNNKVRGGGRGGRQHIGRGPPPLATGPYATANQRGGDGYHQRDSYGSNQPRGQIPYPHQSFSASHIHGDVAYARGGRIGQIGQTHADPYFFPNYPPQTMYNPAGYIYDPAYYQGYQQFQQQQQAYSALYPAGNVIITPDGAIDTSVPPPSMLPNLHHQGHQSAASVQQDTQSSSSSLPPPPPPPPPAPPLPIEPPPRFTPPPPPPPE